VFDAVIVGSGFGGSVMAYRLAEAGMRDVVVLERGQAYPPGSFPRVLQSVRTSFWDPSEQLYGLYNVWFFRRVAALVASGVGGGSLVYANVLLRKDPAWFRGWPITRGELEPHYDACAKLLRPTKFPAGGAYDTVEKAVAFRHAARAAAARDAKLTVFEPDLAITFARELGTPFEEHGIARRSCTLCGECIVGCNVGAKNTLDLTYLAAAQKHGARVLANHEVRAFRPLANGAIEVDVRVHDPETRGATQTTFTTKRLILAAGAFGSTHLMMRNLHAFGAAPKSLGTRFSGNGDILSIVRACTKPDGSPWRLDPTRGPTITSALRHADALDDGQPTHHRGFYLQDGGFPKELAWLLEGMQTPGWLQRGARFVRDLVKKTLGRDPDTDLGKELHDLLGGADLSSRTMPIVAMGRDEPDGKFRLDGNRLHLDWSRDAARAYFDNVEAVARSLARELGGKFIRHIPTYFFGRAVTVHPLGGCPMGRSAADGVVDSYGKSFVHDGLYVVDGSIMPGPVGPNPAFTIAAVADRAASRIAKA
jgi:cholesterol oxidase